MRGSPATSPGSSWPSRARLVARCGSSCPGSATRTVMTLDPEVSYWAEMAEAFASGHAIQAGAELPGDPVGAVVARPGDAVAFAFRKLDIPFFNRVVGFGVARTA